MLILFSLGCTAHIYRKIIAPRQEGGLKVLYLQFIVNLSKCFCIEFFWTELHQLQKYWWGILLENFFFYFDSKLNRSIHWNILKYIKSTNGQFHFIVFDCALNSCYLYYSLIEKILTDFAISEGLTHNQLISKLNNAISENRWILIWHVLNLTSFEYVFTCLNTFIIFLSYHV